MTEPSRLVSAECPRNVFATRSGQNETQSQETGGAARREADGPPTRSGDNGASKERVRQPYAAPVGHGYRRGNTQRPAHPSNRLVVHLNATWRVVDDPLQWRLQRKKGNPRTKNPGWQDRSFCTTREGLLRCIREYCDEVQPAALAKLRTLPPQHAMQNLDVRRTDLGHADSSTESSVSNGSEVNESERGQRPTAPSTLT
jgi:hypothetical protein